jgi:predicted ATP-grasp superfamily ATP-dependent carboligase
VLRRRQRLGAIVLGSDFKALGVVRSLGRQGVPSVVIDNLPRSAWFSRYVVKRFRWNGPMDDAAFLNFLLNVGKEHHLEQWMLFPVQDEVAELIAHNSRQLASIYRLVTQDWNIVQWAHDKRLTYLMAEEIGVPYPKTWYPTNEDDLRTTKISFPAIIKPAISARLHYVIRLKALPANSYKELFAQYRLAAKIISPDEIMVQEVIPGDGHTQYSVAAYCKDGHVIMSMTARRTRQYPIDYGLSSSFVEALEIPALFDPAEKLLRNMGVSGMVEVEFKHDLRDKQYKLLDINVRPWGWHTLCIACGLDFPYIQYCDVLGQAPVAISPRYGYHWVRLLTDIPGGIQEVRAGITTPGGYLHSFAGKTVFSVLDVRDPLPALGDFVVALSRLINGQKRLRFKVS